MSTCLAALLQAQPQPQLLFASEKVYTVLAVVLLVWVGLLAAFFAQQARLRRLEAEVERLQALQAAQGGSQGGGTTPIMRAQTTPPEQGGV